MLQVLCSHLLYDLTAAILLSAVSSLDTENTKQLQMQSRTSHKTVYCQSYLTLNSVAAHKHAKTQIESTRFSDCFLSHSFILSWNHSGFLLDFFVWHTSQLQCKHFLMNTQWSEADCKENLISVVWNLICQCSGIVFLSNDLTDIKSL